MSNSVARLTLAALACYASPAFAYIDPGTGSTLISAFVALLASAIFLIKTYWFKLKRLLGLGSPRNQTSGHIETKADADSDAR
jgi:hypothetical protein